MKKSCSVYVVLLSLVFCTMLQAQATLPHTTPAGRDSFRTVSLQFIDATLQTGLAQCDENTLKKFFYLTELLEQPRENAIPQITALLNDANGIRGELRRMCLQNIYALYPKVCTELIRLEAERAENPKQFAMCCEYLYREGVPASELQHLLQNKYPSYEEHPILHMLSVRLQDEEFSVPDLKELLTNALPKNVPVIFSLQRRNRNYSGIAIVRDTNGAFVKNPNGSIFSIPQLARSITNMPGYLTNGNTPQGILSITGMDTSTSKAIGPTANIQTVLPFETDDAVYYHAIANRDTNSLQAYLQLLPQSWQSYLPLQEAFWAGKAGRSEIIVHGTTVDPEMYRNRPYYPNTPSLGCLCAFEAWNGTLVWSFQQQLANAFISTGKTRGYLVVVNISDDNKPVSAKEAENLINN